MSTRNPTAFNQYNNEATLQSRQAIRTTVPSAIVDDQHFVLDCPVMAICDFFEPIKITDTGGAYFTIRSYYIRSKDMCGLGDANLETPHVWAIYAWNDGGGSTYRFKLTCTTAASDADNEIDVSSSTKQWIGGDTTNNTLNLDANNNINTVELAVKIVSGSGDCWISGIALVALET